MNAFIMKKNKKVLENGFVLPRLQMHEKKHCHTDYH
jgi:hypothetical protein